MNHLKQLSCTLCHLTVGQRIDHLRKIKVLENSQSSPWRLVPQPRRAIGQAVRPPSQCILTVQIHLNIYKQWRVYWTSANPGIWSIQSCGRRIFSRSSLSGKIHHFYRNRLKIMRAWLDKAHLDLAILTDPSPSFHHGESHPRKTLLRLPQPRFPNASTTSLPRFGWNSFLWFAL